MSGGLEPYADMKDSGLAWLGAIPAHWELQRGKTLFERVERPVRDVDEVVTCFRDGTVTLRKNRRTEGFTESIKEVGYQGIRKGDLVIHAMDAFAGAVGVSGSDGKGTPVYAVCTPRADENPLYHALTIREMARSQWILALATGIRERSTDFRFGTYATQLVPKPPPDEQAAIVRYLDHVDRRVRRLVRAKRKLIALLTEQKQAIIHRAVTRGLDPDVPLKDSGVALLGQVPAHWRVVRVRDLLGRIDQGISPQAEAMLAEDGWWGVLKSGCVNGGVFRQTEHKRLPDGFAVDESLALAVGDVLVSRACGSPRYVGSVGRVRKLDYRLILSDKTFRLVFRDEAFVEFFVHTAQSTYFRMHVELALRGAEGLANNLPLTSLKALPLLVPPRDEAEAIAKAIDTKLARLWAAEERAQTEIALLNEYRTRLIADVVTGKLDVRATAASLADESGEPATLDEAEEDSAADDPAVDLDLVPEEAEA